jgi:hypothetical protein
VGFDIRHRIAAAVMAWCALGGLGSSFYPVRPTPERTPGSSKPTCSSRVMPALDLVATGFAHWRETSWKPNMR